MRRGAVHRAAALLAVALLAACGGEEGAPPIQAPSVMVARAESRDVMDRIQATGQLLAKAEATVAAQVGGEVTGIPVDEGTAAEQGEVIIAIDPERRQLELENARASLLQAQAQLDEARRESERIESLARRGAASQSRLDQARTELDLSRARRVAAEAQLGLAQRALDDANVTAPFKGLVARRYVNVGEFVNPSDPLFDIVALDPVEVEFHLAEVDAPRVAIGQGVEVRVATFPDEVFHAEVSVVSPTIDDQMRTRRVKAVLPNPDGRLLPGTFARVDLGVAERKGVVLIPKEAVLQRSDGSVVFRLVGDDRVERLRVDTGTHRGDLVEVRSGVAADDVIVVRGQTALVDGGAVTVRRADGSAVGSAPPSAVARDAPSPKVASESGG